MQKRSLHFLLTNISIFPVTLYCILKWISSEYGAQQLLTDFAYVSTWVTECSIISQNVRNHLLKNEVLRRCEGVGRLLLRHPGEAIAMHKQLGKLNVKFIWNSYFLKIFTIFDKRGSIVDKCHCQDVVFFLLITRRCVTLLRCFLKKRISLLLAAFVRF